MATLDAPRLTAPYVYGRITVLASESVAKFPKITITYANRSQSPTHVTVGRSGSYCFPITGGVGGTLIIDINGIEVARRDVPDFGPAQKREDFQVSVPGSAPTVAPPGVVSSKFSYPPNDKTVELYRTAVRAEEEKDLKAAIVSMRQVVAIDPNDFIAWAHLGTLHFKTGQLQDADAAYRKALALREDYTPAWINVGKLRIAQKQLEAAIEIFKHAAALEPDDARIFRFLGETYLRNKQGTLGAQALNHAIRLDPIGQAECHLQLAHLFELAKANDLAVKEYQKFLEKVPDHPDRKKLEKFISENKPTT
jgi:Flp pilus assembly protein TadD